MKFATKNDIWLVLGVFLSIGILFGIFMNIQEVGPPVPPVDLSISEEYPYDNDAEKTGLVFCHDGGEFIDRNTTEFYFEAWLGELSWREFGEGVSGTVENLDDSPSIDWEDPPFQTTVEFVGVCGDNGSDGGWGLHEEWTLVFQSDNCSLPVHITYVSVFDTQAKKQLFEDWPPFLNH